MSPSKPGYGSGAWLILLLLAAVAVPTACVLWFMSAAVRNERLAVREKLAEAYRPQLSAATAEIQTYWKAKAAALGDFEGETPAAPESAGFEEPPT